MAERPVVALAELEAGVVRFTTAVRTLDSAMKSLGATSEAVSATARGSLAETGKAATQVAQGIKDVTKEWQDAQIAMLEHLRQSVIPFEGTDAGSRYSFDKLIEDQLAKVKGGSETATEAIQELQRQFGAVYGVLQRKYFGSTDPGEREFLLMMEQFINSGNVNI